MIDNMQKSLEYIEITESSIKEQFKIYDSIALHNQAKVLAAFNNNNVSEGHLQGSTGYGYNDIGRDTLDKIYAEVFGAEAAIVRGQFVSGTHAISSAINGLLFPGDEVIFASGMPYDTLHKVIGWTTNSKHSLLSKGIKPIIVPLENNKINLNYVLDNINDKTKMIYFQKSRGYTNRDAFSNKALEEVFKVIKSINNSIIIFVDNCYGEFVEKTEPSDHGADVIAGSLIKNPGGGLAPWGGYIAGKEDLITQIMDYAVAPGLGRDMGGTNYILRSYYQGLFMAPSIVKQSIQGAILLSAVMKKLGFTVSPEVDAARYDIIQSITFHDKNLLLSFCKNIQHASPIDSMATPIPGDLPGYDSQVIMAAGTFIQGASIELSADAPVKEPYTVYVQGGLTYEHIKIAIIKILNQMIEYNMIKIN
jgi:cystathionine beta-lyase family protein involved in aluminum resistance